MKTNILFLSLSLLFLFVLNCSSRNEESAIMTEHKEPFNNSAKNNSLAISSDNQIAVASNSGETTIKVYDLNTKQLKKVIDEFVTPRNIVFSKDNSRIYVTDSGSGNLVEIETAAFNIVKRYDIGKGIFGSQLSTDGSLLYINNAAEHQVVIFDLQNMKIIQKIKGFNQPRQGIALHNGSNILYVTNFGNNKIQMVNTISRKIVGEISGFDHIRGISVSSDGKTLYAANSGSNSISIVDITSRKIIQNIIVGKEPYGSVVSPDNTFLLSGNAGDNTVSYINLQTKKVEYVITGFLEPRQAIIYSKDGKFAYILNRDLSISKVSIEEKKIISTISS